MSHQTKLLTTEESYRAAPCPRCKLYHNTRKENLAEIRKHGLKGYGGVECSAADWLCPIIKEADAYIQDAGCSHDGAVFFYNDKSMASKPYIEVDIRDISCSIDWALQDPWEMLVSTLNDKEDGYEESAEELANSYCETMDEYSDGQNLIFDEEKVKIVEEEIRPIDREAQIMVLCDLPPDILKIVEG
jgi:hypothetical protein